MKIRKGFVSNSSSSSFVVAYTIPEPCEHCGRTDPDIIEAVRLAEARDDDYGDTSLGNYENTDQIITFLKEVHNIGEEYCSMNDKILFTKVSAEVAKYMEKGYEFAVLNISYHNAVLRDMLNDAKNVVVLETWGE